MSSKMSYSYAERMYGSSSRGARPTRGSYLPPQIRNDRFTNFQNTDRFQYPIESYPRAPNSDTYAGRTGRGRGGRGRGGGPGRGGRGSSFLLRDFDDPYSNSYQSRTRVNSDPFYVTEKLNELNVDEEKSYGGEGINFEAYEDIPVETTGNNVPPPVDSFDEIDFAERLNENIKRCKYVKPTPVQRYSIPISLAARDLMACAQTGSGKTAAFCFPIISGILKNQISQPRNTRVAQPLALVLSPTRELSIQIHEEAKKFAHETGVKIGVAYGGVPIIEQLRILERGVDILVATPGRLVDMIERARVSLHMIKYLALDEADRMLDMGFEPQIRQIVEKMDMPPPGKRQTMLFSATFPDDIQKLAGDFLLDYIFLSVGRVGSSTDLIAQRVDFVSDTDKRNHLMGILCAPSSKKLPLTLVFVETKRGADSLEQWLCYNGFPAVAIHGDKIQWERERALKCFKCGSKPIMVATDVAARGLDIPNVAHVINFDLPNDIDAYVHRIGRTGRAGKSGTATAFFGDKNAPLAKPLADLMNEAKQQVPQWLAQYAERAFPSSGGRGNRRYGGGSRFGGRDFRNNTPSRTTVDDDSYNFKSRQDEYSNPKDSYSRGKNSHYTAEESYSPANMRESYGQESEIYSQAGEAYSSSTGYQFDNGPVVATGWE